MMEIVGYWRIYVIVLWCLAAFVTSKPPPAKGKDKSELPVPLPAIILLSVLGFCLILFAVLYKFLSFDKCCPPDKDDKKSDRTPYVELSQADDVSDAEEYEEDGQSGSGFESLTVSNPAHTMDKYAYPGLSPYLGGRPKLAKGRSASMASPRQIDPRFFLAVEDRQGDKMRKNSFDGERIRSESDLSVGASAADYNARYGSWAHGLHAPVVNAHAHHQRAMSAYGDLTSLRALQEKRDGKFAKVQVSLWYAPTAQRLEIEILRVEEVCDALIRSGIATEVVVHASILPSKRNRFKTKAKSIQNASFHERWVIRNVSKKELFLQQLRFRLYSHEFLGTGRILGETTVDIMSFDLEEVACTKWLLLLPTPDIKKLLKI